jgi:hypothetical protein
MSRDGTTSSSSAIWRQTPGNYLVACGAEVSHNECPEKICYQSTPSCCLWKLAADERSHLPSYRNCSHTKEMHRGNLTEHPAKAQEERCSYSNAISQPFSQQHNATSRNNKLSVSFRTFPFYPICTTCLVSLILFDLIILMMFGEEYRSWSSSLRNFL